MEEALSALAADGLVVTRVPAPFDESVAVDWFTIASADLAQSMLEHEPHWASFEPSLGGQLAYGTTVTTFDYIAAQRRRYECAARLDDLLGTDGVLVVPTANSSSWPAEGPMPTSAGSVDNDLAIAVNTTDLNFTGHPAVNVPLGYDAFGVPFGLQIVAPRFADGLALGLAQVLERVRPWPEVATGYEPYRVA